MAPCPSCRQLQPVQMMPPVIICVRAQEDLLADMRAAYQREAVERRRLHNLVQELRGNIRVYVRVKPVTAEEAAAGARSVLRCETDSRISCNVQGSQKVRASVPNLLRPRCCLRSHYRAVSTLVRRHSLLCLRVDGSGTRPHDARLVPGPARDHCASTAMLPSVM